MMKKLVFFLIIFMGFNITADAALITTGSTYATLSKSTSDSTMYYMKVGTSSYLAFCQDTNLSYGPTGTNISDNVFVVSEEIGAREIDEAGSVQFYDQAVLAIFEYFDDKTVNYNNYHAQALALRALTALFNFDIGSESDTIIAFENIAVSWMSADDTIKSQITTINSLFYEYAANKTDVYQLETAYQYNTSGSLITVPTALSRYSDSTINSIAKAAFKEGIQAIIDYINNGFKQEEEASITENVSDESQLYSTDYFYTTLGYDKDDYAVDKIVLTPENFESNGTVNLSVSKDSDLSAVCLVYYGSTGKYVSFNCNSGSNYSIVDGDKIIVYIYDKVEDDEFCGSLGYSVTYSYTEDSISNKVYVIRHESSSTVDYQRFFISVPADDVSQTITGAISPCAGDCSTEVVIPSNCLEVDLGSKDTYVGTVTTSSNIEYCVIDNTDDAGNSYTVGSCSYDTDGNGKTDTDNGMSGVADQTSKTYGDYTYNLTYGTVSCYEEYSKIEFPGVQDSDSGRYIKINAYIKGTKTCITSDIDYDAFIDDIIQAQEAMVDAYNEYMSYEEATTTDSKTVDTSRTCGTSKSCSYTNYYLGKTSEGVTDTYNKEVISFYSDGSASLNDTVNTNTWNNISFGSCTKNCSTCGTEPDTYSCWGTLSKSNGDSSELTEDRLEGMSDAEDDLEYAQEAFKQAITNLLSLIGGESFNYSIVGSLDGWSMLFPINPVIEYSYGENYTSLLKTKDTYLVETKVVTTNPSYVYSSSVDTDDELDDDAFEDRVFVYCTTSGCKEYTFKDFPTDEINYVISSIDKSITYETPDVFYNYYPTGTVVYYEDSTQSSSQETLVNGLPISLSTSKGLYTFSFTITNFGEYYDDCTGGRLNEVIEETDDNEYGFTNEYVCKYRINCPDCEIGTNFELTSSTTDICTTCILDGSFQMYFRTISTNTSTSGSLSNTFNPNDRDLGYNWSSNTEYSIIAGKAEKTLTEIYDIDYDAYSEEPLLTVTLTASIASYISETYNSSSSYADDTLTCYDWGDYENVFCYSDVLTELSSGTYSSNFDFTDSRTGNITYDVDDEEGKYWTAWVIEETTEYYFGGPAWK